MFYVYLLCYDEFMYMCVSCTRVRTCVCVYIHDIHYIHVYIPSSTHVVKYVMYL